MGNSDKTWPTGGGNGEPLHYSYHRNPMNTTKREKDMKPEEEPLRLEGVQYTSGEEWREMTNSSRKNEASGPKWKWCLVVDVSGDAKVKVKVKLLSRVRLCEIPWTVTSQVPLSMGILQARILEWVAMHSSRGSSRPRDWTLVFHIVGRHFTVWATREVFWWCK